MATPLSLDDTVVVSNDQVAADLAEEVVILGMKEGVYFSVSAVAARIWALLQTPRRVADVVVTLTSEYDVPADACTADVLAFVEELAARGLVVRDAPSSP
ncbi:MAG: PqqD family peptide modification chaperone [Gemmatimonadaceae bacterium]